MKNNVTKELKWFLTALKQEFDVDVLAEDLGTEAVALWIDEIEDYFVPIEVLHKLPETLLYEIMLYSDEENNDYVGAIVFHPH